MVYVAVTVGAGEAGLRVASTMEREREKRKGPKLSYKWLGADINPEDYYRMGNLKKYLKEFVVINGPFWIIKREGGEKLLSYRYRTEIPRYEIVQIDRCGLKEIHSKLLDALDEWRRIWGEQLVEEAGAGGKPLIMLISSAGGRSGSQISLDLSKEIKEEEPEALVWQILILPRWKEFSAVSVISAYNLLRFAGKVFAKERNERSIDLLSLIDNEALIDNIIRKPSLRLYRPGMSGDALYDAINTAIFYMLEPLLTLYAYQSDKGIGEFQAGIGTGIGVFAYSRAELIPPRGVFSPGLLLSFMRSLCEERNLSVPDSADKIRESAEGRALCFPVVRGPPETLPEEGIRGGLSYLETKFGGVAAEAHYPLRGLREHEASMHVSNLVAFPPSTQELIRRGLKHIKGMLSFSCMRADLARVLEVLGEDGLKRIIGGEEEEKDELIEMMKSWIRR